MGYARDAQDQSGAYGSTGSITKAQDQLSLMARTRRQRGGGLVSDPLQVVNPEIDYMWAQGQVNSKAPHNYFDYFFTGQDIKVYIDGADLSEYGSHMPVMQLGFNIQQQKQPLYGFASYTYDAIMRGNRVVSGVMRLATKDVHYMTEALQLAAEARANQQEGLYEIRGLTTDEELIETYWGRNIDPEVAYNDNKHIWSSHPPFNLVVVYGLQSTSVQADLTGRVNEVLEEYKSLESDNMLFTDTNERLVESDVLHYSQRRVLENVELTGLQIEYNPDGQVCSEVYSFLARDMKITKV